MAERVIECAVTLFSVVILLAVDDVCKVECLDNGLALTPPMGWLAWERFRCNIDCKNDPDNCISEKLFRDMADHLEADGYKEAGYQYVNIDDCWLSEIRTPDGHLQPDVGRFPSGMKNLSNYIHSKGLKFGIYEDFGEKTCAGYPGIYYHMQMDANTFADWGVDMLKLDGCYANIEDMDSGYPAMGKWLNQTGRPILYSCSWPAYQVGHMKPDYKSIAESCNIWRNYGDIQDSWDSIKDIIQFYGKNPGNFSQFAGPGRWNDPDMLILGDFGLSYEQQKAQFAMWSMFAAPLFVSVDLRTINAESKALLLNKNIIAINQDPLGVQGIQISQSGSISVWKRPLITPKKGSWAFAVLNTGDGGMPVKVQVKLQTIINDSGSYAVVEAFHMTTIGTFKSLDTVMVSVNSTGVFIGLVIPT